MSTFRVIRHIHTNMGPGVSYAGHYVATDAAEAIALAAEEHGKGDYFALEMPSVVIEPSHSFAVAYSHRVEAMPSVVSLDADELPF
jgi:hypothetical protein